MQFKMNCFFAVILILYCNCSFAIATAEVKYKLLTSYDAVMLALRFHPNVKNAQLDRIVDKFSLEVAHNHFMLQYGLTGMATWSKNNQQTQTGNAEIYLNSTLGGRFAVKKNFGDNDNYGIEFSQPLLRGFGSDVNLVDLESAKDNEYIGFLNLQGTLINTIDEALIAYWNLMAAQRGSNVQKTSLDLLRKTLESYEIKVKVGQMAKASLDQQKTAVLNGELLYEDQLNKVNLAKQNLLMSLGLDPNAKINIEEDFSSISRIKLPALDQCIALALKHNLDYLRQKMTNRALYRSLLIAQDQQNWQLDAAGSVNNQGEWTAGINMSVPINDLPREQQLVQAKVSYEKGQRDLLRQKQILISDIKNRWYNCSSQLEQIRISVKSVKSAYNDYKMALLKQMSGMTSTFEVISLQQQWVDAQLALINLKISYLNSLISLHAKLGTTLQIWGVEFAMFGE